MEDIASDPFLELLDHGRLGEVVGARRRRRWLEQQAVESAGMVGVLLDLAEAGAAVLVTTTSGRAHGGTVVGVGTDVLVLRVAGDRRLLVALAGVASIAATGSSGVRGSAPARPAGDRSVDAARLVDLVAELAGPRGGRTTIWMGQVGPVSGIVSAVGTDIVAVALADGVRYLPVAAISEVLVGPER